jgi:hypothetical protein
MQKTTAYTGSQGETLKPGRWHKKGEQNKGYQFKNTEP